MASLSRNNLNEATRALYTRVAFYYYERGMTQEQIAKSLQMSRQRVNRILGECRDLGIVEIRIHQGDANYLALETMLEEKYALKAVRVAPGVTPENIYTELGLHAGRYLTEVLRDGDVIGFSRGKSLSAMVTQMPAIAQKNLTAVQLMGGWNDREKNVSGDDIVHRFTERVPARMVILYAPVVVQDRGLHDTITREPYFLDAYKVIQDCTVAVLGIGQVGVSHLLPMMQGGKMSDFLPEDAVGEVCARFFDVQGRPVETEYDGRIVAVEREDLMRVPLRVGIAGDLSKLPAILGAVRGGYVNALVTDAETAMALNAAGEEGRA